MSKEQDFSVEVGKPFERLKRNYRNRENASHDKERLRKSEIAIYEYLFLTHEDKKTHTEPVGFRKAVPLFRYDMKGKILPSMFEKYHYELIVNGQIDLMAIGYNEFLFAVYTMAYFKYLEWLKDLQPPQRKNSKITNPAIALFCHFINESKILPKNENEAVEVFCKRVCEVFKLEYKDKVRTEYNDVRSNSRKHLLKKYLKTVHEAILPMLDEATNNKLHKYLDKKGPTNQNLYA